MKRSSHAELCMSRLMLLHRYGIMFPCPWRCCLFCFLPICNAQQTKTLNTRSRPRTCTTSADLSNGPGAPAAKGDSFPICVFGQDPFGAALDTTLSGETIDGKAVVAKRVSKPQDALNCRILYISASEESRLKEIIAGLDKAGVLTVSDMPQFSQRGGMIQFVMDGKQDSF